MVVLLAFAAAACNAVASILQRMGVESAPEDAGTSLRLVSHMLHRRVWIMGFVVMAAGFGCQATALYLGSLVVVQPILVSELVVVVAAMGLWFAMPVSARDVVGCLFAAGGLAAFLVVAATVPGTKVPDLARWATVAVVVIVPAALLIALSLTGAKWWRATARGAAASLGFALTAALTKSATDALSHGFVTLLTSWQTWALVVMGLVSFLLMQSAFHAGPFTASQIPLILVNPLVSIPLGIYLFGDRIATGATNVAFEVMSLAAMTGGALVLAASKLVAGVHSEDQSEHVLAGRGLFARRRARR